MTYNYYGGAGISDTAIHKSAGSGVKLIQGTQINRRSEAEILHRMNKVL